MGGAERVVFAFRPFRKSGQAAALTERANAVAATGEDLVRIALVAYVPDQTVIRGVEYVVQRNRQLDDTEPCSEMATGLCDRVDGFRTQFVGKLFKLIGRQVFEIARDVDAVEQGRF